MDFDPDVSLVETKFSHLLTNIVDEDEFHQSQAKLSMARNDKVPTHDNEFPGDARDPGVDVATFDELFHRIKTATDGSDTSVNVSEFFDTVIYGYLYDDYGPQPPGNPDVLLQRPGQWSGMPA